MSSRPPLPPLSRDSNPLLSSCPQMYKNKLPNNVARWDWETGATQTKQMFCPRHDRSVLLPFERLGRGGPTKLQTKPSLAPESSACGTHKPSTPRCRSSAVPPAWNLNEGEARSSDSQPQFALQHAANTKKFRLLLPLARPSIPRPRAPPAWPPSANASRISSPRRDGHARPQAQRVGAPSRKCKTRNWINECIT